MKKLVIYTADTNVAKKILFGTDLTESVGIELNKEVSIFESLNYLKGKGLKAYVTEVDELEGKDITEYIGGFDYEINLTPYAEVGETKTSCIQLSGDFDDDDFESLLSVPEVLNILEHDSNFSKLVDQVGAMAYDYDIVLNYLVSEYGFRVNKFHYYEKSEEDKD